MKPANVGRVSVPAAFLCQRPYVAGMEFGGSEWPPAGNTPRRSGARQSVTQLMHPGPYERHDLSRPTSIQTRRAQL